jgi:hypothetical protein
LGWWVLKRELIYVKDVYRYYDEMITYAEEVLNIGLEFRLYLLKILFKIILR